MEALDLAKNLELCYTNPKFCAKFLFAETFSRPFSKLHNEIISVMFSPSRRKVIAAPRSIGKTSLVKLLIMRSILFREAKFVVYIHNSATQAELLTESIKDELISNELVRSFFGDIRASDEEVEYGDKFSQKAWVAFGSTLVLPRGSGQRVRGLLWKRYRPDLIVVDDLEDKEEVLNPNVRLKQKEWFFSDVMNAIDVYSTNNKVVYIDTIKHEDSLLQLLLESPEWESTRLSICSDTYESNAPEFISTETIKQMVKEHEEKGLLDVFYMEMMSLPIATTDAVFRREYFKYYDEADLVKEKAIVETIVIVDPAKTVKLSSAESAIVAVGIDFKSNKIYVRDVVHGRMYPDELFERVFEVADKFRATVVGYEDTGINEFISQPLNAFASMKGRFYELVKLSDIGGEKHKDRRIAALAPYYRRGMIYHNRHCCAPLEQQLLAHPRSKLKDVADAFSYFIQMLELGERYFSTASLGYDEPDDYSELLDYDESSSEWRII